MSWLFLDWFVPLYLLVSVLVLAGFGACLYFLEPGLQDAHKWSNKTVRHHPLVASVNCRDDDSNALIWSRGRGGAGARRAAGHLDRGAARTRGRGGGGGMRANTLKMEKENERERWRGDYLMKANPHVLSFQLFCDLQHTSEITEKWSQMHKEETTTSRWLEDELPFRECVWNRM